LRSSFPLIHPPDLILLAWLSFSSATCAAPLFVSRAQLLFHRTFGLAVGCFFSLSRAAQPRMAFALFSIFLSIPFSQFPFENSLLTIPFWLLFITLILAFLD
jgi:hypothetical protein